MDSFLNSRDYNRYFYNDLHGFKSISRCSLPIKNPKLNVPSLVPLWYEKLPLKMRRWALEWYWKDREEEESETPQEAWSKVWSSLFYKEEVQNNELVEPYVKNIGTTEYNIDYYTNLDGYEYVERSVLPLYDANLDEPSQSHLPEWYKALSKKMKNWAIEWYWSNVNTHTNVEDPKLAFENVKYFMFSKKD